MLVRSDRDVALRTDDPIQAGARKARPMPRGKPTFNGSLGECGREEGQRQSHVDMAQGAFLALAIDCHLTLNL